MKSNIVPPRSFEEMIERAKNIKFSEMRENPDPPEGYERRYEGVVEKGDAVFIFGEWTEAVGAIGREVAKADWSYDNNDTILHMRTAKPLK